jgi:hypothetical protein
VRALSLCGLAIGRCRSLRRQAEDQLRGSRFSLFDVVPQATKLVHASARREARLRERQGCVVYVPLVQYVRLVKLHMLQSSLGLTKPGAESMCHVSELARDEIVRLHVKHESESNHCKLTVLGCCVICATSLHTSGEGLVQSKLQFCFPPKI